MSNITKIAAIVSVSLNVIFIIAFVVWAVGSKSGVGVERAYGISYKLVHNQCEKDAKNDASLDCSNIQLEHIEQLHASVQGNSTEWSMNFTAGNNPKIWRYNLQLDSSGRVVSSSSGYLTN